MKYRYGRLILFLKQKKVIDSVYLRKSTFFQDVIFYGSDLNLGGKYKQKAGGAAFDKFTALSICIGESLERYVTSFGGENIKVILGNYNNLSQENKLYFPPKNHKYNNQDLASYDFENSNFIWVEGYDFTDNKKVLIPRQLTSWLQDKNLSEPTLSDRTTNGSAGYFDLETCVKKSILEVVQRDAFLLFWLTKTSPNVIDIDTLPEKLRLMINKIQQKKMLVYVLDITTDIKIPSVCITVISDYDDIPRIIVAASTDFTFERAIESATMEAYKCCNFLKFQGELSFKEGEYSPFNTNIKQIDRFTMWRGDTWLERFKFFISGEKVDYKSLVNIDITTNGKDQSRYLRELFKKMGQDYHPYIHICESKVLTQVGFFVSQAFINICIPFYLNERFATTHSKRIDIFLKYKNLNKYEVNIWPHPFT